MAEYRFALYDLLSRAQLSEHMPFDVQNYSRSLIEAGTTTASLGVGDARIQAMKPWDLTRPRRTTVGVIRDEVMVGEYLIWQRPPYKPTELKLNISASELRSYFDHRLFRPTTGVGSAKTLAFTQADQFDIFRALVADCQSVTWQGLPVGDLGIEMDASQMSGVLVDRRDTASTEDAYHGYSFTPYGDLLDQLVALTDGFEWRIDSYLDAQHNLRRALRLGYPYLGVAPGPDAVTLEYPGSIVDYEWPEDGSSSANYVATVGAGENLAMQWGEAYAGDELAAGFPLLERTSSYKSVTVLATLIAHATADVATLEGDVTVPALTVLGRPDIAPGDHVFVRISDEARFAGSSADPVERYMRAVQVTTDPGPPETTTIAIEQPRTPGEGN